MFLALHVDALISITPVHLVNALFFLERYFSSSSNSSVSSSVDALINSTFRFPKRNFYKEMLDKIDTTVSANEFVIGSEHRL